MGKLKTEQDTPEMGKRIEEAFAALSMVEHDNTGAVFEHGQWWISCSACGGQWSACDATGPSSAAGFCFELVTEPDGSCDEDS